VLAELARLSVAHGHARAHGARIGALICVVGAGILGGLGALEAVVGVDLVLELRRDLLVVVGGGAALGLVLVGRDSDGPAFVGRAHRLPRDEGAPRHLEAHLHAYVLGLVVLVDEEVVYPSNLQAGLVVDLVSGEAVF
jgi:hypothetical protein